MVYSTIAAAAVASCGSAPSCPPAASPDAADSGGPSALVAEGLAADGPGQALGQVVLTPADLRDRPVLLQQLVESPFAYFRFVGIDAAEAVCRHFSEDLSRMPVVNLHGDAHVEQYSVTQIGRGLADFDDASTGPAVIDLSRFASSVRLACRLRGWQEDESRVLDAFFRGYRDALERPDIKPPEPSFVRRLRAEVTRTPGEFLAWSDAMMRPLGTLEQRRFEAAMDRFRLMMVEVRPDLSESFFDIKRSGGLSFGIGSALDKKLLVRIDGPTSGSDDDIVLEVKEVRDMRRISCVHAGVGAGAFRVLLGQSRIGRVPQAVLGYVPRGNDEDELERPLWVQSWSHDYRELSVADVESADELAEVSYDVGVQLGLGHTVQIAAPLDVQLRYAQRAMLDAYRGEIAAFADTQATASQNAWKQFHDAAESMKEARQ
jgi:hypothetical protein